MRLRTYRERERLTLEQLGERIGRTGVAVSRYETGARVPGPEDMVRIYVATSGAVEPNDFYDLPDLAPVRGHPESEAA